MNEIYFRNWMNKKGYSAKMSSDSISRIKRLEHELGNTDIDIEYKKDRCCYLLSLFNNTGRNSEMAKYNTTLPIGKYTLGTYKYAVKLYISFLESTQ